MTKKEYILQHIGFERGMIRAWVHVRNLCNSCIKAHREEITKKRIKELVAMNKKHFHSI